MNEHMNELNELIELIELKESLERPFGYNSFILFKY